LPLPDRRRDVRWALNRWLIRRRCYAEASLKVSMKVALIGEACSEGGLRDGFAGLQ
jgi:hypothetical protein